MMNKDSVIDYLSCILFKALSFFIRRLPFALSFFLGRRLGEIIYFCDTKHRSVVYANIKTAFGDRISPKGLHKHVRGFYRSFGQTLIEFFLLPLVDKKYLDKYITFEGLDNVTAGFKKGKGVIFLVMHEGSWEISNIISANLGYPFSIVVREQKRYKRLSRLLNSYRSQKGTKLIEARDQTKKIIEALKKNEAIAITLDQGGRSGSLVKFFGKNASMSTGAVRLFLRLGATIIPVFSARTQGPYIKFIIEPPYEIRETSEKEQAIQENLQQLVSIFEKYIIKYPNEYLWTYKIWKYTNEKKILIISDGKTGHLRQSQAVADIIEGYYKQSRISADIQTVEAKLKNSFLSQGIKPDIVISCGSSVAALNLAISKENLAKSISIMRPSVLNTKRFDLVIMGRHDRPLKRKNIVVTDGALNLINEDYLKLQADILRQRIQINKKFVLGLLVGGDAKDFRLRKDLIMVVLEQIKALLDKVDGQILISTSRRTNNEIESLLRQEFNNYPRCGLLVIANEKNIPQAIGGILGLSQIIITSPESISMISEAVNSKKYVLVFNSQGISAKHRRFLEFFAKNKYIYLVEPVNLSNTIESIWINQPTIVDLKDNSLVEEAIKRIL